MEDQFRRRRTFALAALATAAAAAGAWWLLTGPAVGIHGVSVAATRGPTARRSRPPRASSRARGRSSTCRPGRCGRRSSASRGSRTCTSRATSRGASGRDHPGLAGRRRGAAARARGCWSRPTAGCWARRRPAAASPGCAWPAPRPRRGPGSPRRTRAVPGAGRALAARAVRPPAGARVEGGQLSAAWPAGRELRLGPPDDIAVKAQALTVVLGHLTPDEERTATYLDVSVPERPALGTAPRRERGSPPPAPSAAPANPRCMPEAGASSAKTLMHDRVLLDLPLAEHLVSMVDVQCLLPGGSARTVRIRTSSDA